MSFFNYSLLQNLVILVHVFVCACFHAVQNLYAVMDLLCSNAKVSAFVKMLIYAQSYFLLRDVSFCLLPLLPPPTFFFLLWLNLVGHK